MHLQLMIGHRLTCNSDKQNSDTQTIRWTQMRNRIRGSQNDSEHKRNPDPCLLLKQPDHSALGALAPIRYELGITGIIGNAPCPPGYVAAEAQHPDKDQESDDPRPGKRRTACNGDGTSNEDR